MSPKILAGLIVIISGFGLYTISQPKQNQAPLLTPKVNSLASPSPSPDPFQDMTIPYLRQRSYQSSLGPLELISQTSTHSTFLTSYNSDGLKINGLLTKPTGEQPSGGWPAIVFIHGYIPPQQYKTNGPQYGDYVSYFAKKGYVVFKIDLRGHGNSEGEPGGGYYSGDYIVDTLNAKAALESSNFVSPKRIGLWGHSMSGNIAARALAASPDIPAVVIWAGAVYTYSDFSDYTIDDNSYQPPPANSPSRKKRNELFETHGAFNPSDNFWKLVPMTNYLSDIKGAIQIHHALDDSVVDIRYSQNLNQILANTSIIHELKEYPSGGHNISGTSFTTAMQNSVEFFDKFLK